MNNSHKKMFLIAVSAFVVEAALIISSVSKIGSFTKATANNEYSVTFSRTTSTVESGSYASGTAVISSRLAGGTKVFADINGQSFSLGTDIARFDTYANQYVKFYFSGTDVTRFQSIDSLDFVYTSGQGEFDIYYSATEIDFSNPLTYSKLEITGAPSSVDLGASGIHYVALHGREGMYDYARFNSIKINYTCGEPTPEEYSISYYGMDENLDVVPLYGIDTSSLVYSATEGETVVIEPEALTDYEFVEGFGYSENIEDVHDDDGVISFTMPSGDVEFVLVARSTLVTLSSISVSGQQTEFTEGDSFIFGGTVTAHYSDSSSADVTSYATFSGYDMDEVGSQTVTVSYTESGITKTTTYSITVTSDDPGVIVLNGTYNYASRVKYSTPDWKLHNMTITFYSDGTAMWRNVRTNNLSNVFDCKVYFTYVATDTGANITIAMAHTTYDFEKDGEYNNQGSSFSGGGYDRPIDGGIGSATSKNNSGVMASDRSSLTINVYDQTHSFEVYDTFTFNLAS